MRITAKAADAEAAAALIGAEEADLRDVLGDLVFGVDDETMESVVGACSGTRGLTLGLAESVTGGLVGVPVDRRARRPASLPGLDRLLRQRGEARVLGVTAEHGRRARSAPSRWPRAPAGCSAPTSASPSPASPARPSRTASRSARSSSGLRCPGQEPEAVHARLPGDRRGSASSRPSRCSTCARLRLLGRPGSAGCSEPGEPPTGPRSGGRSWPCEPPEERARTRWRRRWSAARSVAGRTALGAAGAGGT